MIKVAIVGNIASGKTQVENILIELGYKVFDSDKIGHKLLKSSKSILDAFSSYDVLENGEISRFKLGKLVFDDKDLRVKLESILHPLIKKEFLNIFDENKNEKYVFISVPLLFEAGMEDVFDKILFVSSSDEIRLNRLMARNNLTKEDTQKRLDSQHNQADKIKHSDYILYNESTLMDLELQIKEIF